MSNTITNTTKFDLTRLKAIIHYISVNCDPKKLGAIKLNKILWYADSYAYAAWGKSLTGDTYIKRQFGPVPQHAVQATKELDLEEKIWTRNDRYSSMLVHRKFFPLNRADVSQFQGNEIALLHEIMDEICNEHTAMSISDASHTEIWEMAEIGEEIPFNTVFVTELAEIDERDVDWVRTVANVLAA